MSKRSKRCCRRAALAALLASLAGAALAQTIGFSAASIEPHGGVGIAGPGAVDVPVGVRIRRGYHINSSSPNEPYLIPTRLSWEGSPLAVESIAYPDPEEVEYDFSDKPLSVYSARIEIVTTFRVDRVPAGLSELRGSLLFQACNDKSCLPPRTIPVTVPVRQ